jgi:cell division protein FtsI (penicillin-binding protein 3)
LRSASFVFRHRAGNAVIFLVLVVAAAQLFTLQVPRAAGLRAEAASQLKVTDVEKAVRGSIVDRNNDKLAFTIEARALTFQPVKIRKQLEEAKAKTPEAPDPQRRLRDIAAEVALRLNNKPDATAGAEEAHRQRLVRVSGACGRSRHRRRDHHQVPRGRFSERQDLRQYPGGSLAANIVGGIDWDGHGLLGLEDSLDAVAGRHGRVDHL